MNFLLWGAVSAGLTVILGAFGAHGLKDIFDEYSTAIYDKAVLYQMFHSLGLLVIGILQKLMPEQYFTPAGLLFILGTILFSGSLYILAITGFKWLGAITPLGGLAFIGGWGYLVIKFTNY